MNTVAAPQLAAYAMTVANAVVAGIFVNAAFAKLAQPDRLRQSLTTTVGGNWGRAVIRVAALAELLTALLLLIPSLRPAAAFACGVFGVTFVGLGLLGMRVRNAPSCGCFGAFSERPLGFANIVLGVLFIAVFPANVWLYRSSVGLAQLWIIGASAASISCLSLAMASAGRSGAGRALIRRYRVYNVRGVGG